MSFPFPTEEVAEGSARLLVPAVPRRKGPGTKGPWPFYNPTMALNRDVSAALVAIWPDPLRDVLDGLAATGAWGIRMALEAGVGPVCFNDRSRLAEELVRENVRRNGLEAEVRGEDLRALLASRAFDFVDVDPFGPPTPYLDAALRTARTPSGIGVTATDTAPLSGTYPGACVRRYGARPLRCAQGHEIGLRILLGYCARVAASHGHRVQPILSFSAEHFLRAHLRVLRAAGRPEAPIGYARRDATGAFLVAGEGGPEAVGPLWLGPLATPDVLSALVPSEWTGPAAARLLDRLRAEAEMPPFFVTTDDLARSSRGSPPRLERFLDNLRSMGFRATRTHFHTRGVKTDAPPGEAFRAFREAAATGPKGG